MFRLVLKPSSVGKNNVSTRDSKTARRARAEEKFRVKFLKKRSARLMRVPETCKVSHKSRATFFKKLHTEFFLSASSTCCF